MDTARYDILARSGSSAGVEQLRLMLQNLLIQRFKLAFHRETKEEQVYLLRIAKGGAKLREVPRDDLSEELSAGAPSRSIGWLADHLAAEFQAPVLDQTGLKGFYKIALDLGPFVTPETKSSDLPIAAGQAMEEQLGLKLELHRAPVEMLIVDRAERVPVEN